MDTQDVTPAELTTQPEDDRSQEEIRKQRQTTIGIVIGAVILLVIMIAGLVFLLSPNTPEEYVARIRDVFIIIMALESLIIGVILFVLIFQLARLFNLLQNEIKPILESTNETVSNLRGTTLFLSENLAEPVIKLNEYLAGIVRLISVIGLTKRK